MCILYTCASEHMWVYVLFTYTCEYPNYIHMRMYLLYTYVIVLTAYTSLCDCTYCIHMWVYLCTYCSYCIYICDLTVYILIILYSDMHAILRLKLYMDLWSSVLTVYTQWLNTEITEFRAKSIRQLIDELELAKL